MWVGRRAGEEEEEEELHKNMRIVDLAQFFFFSSSLCFPTLFCFVFGAPRFGLSRTRIMVFLGQHKCMTVLHRP